MTPTDQTSPITRPRLLAAYERICGPARRDGRLVFPERVDSAEAFLRMIDRQARHRGLTFDRVCDLFGH